MTPIKPDLFSDNCCCECDGATPHARYCPEALAYREPPKPKNERKAPKMKVKA